MVVSSDGGGGSGVEVERPILTVKVNAKQLEKTPASHIRAYMLFWVAFILGADLGTPFLDVGQELQKIVVGQQKATPPPSFFPFPCPWRVRFVSGRGRVGCLPVGLARARGVEGGQR